MNKKLPLRYTKQLLEAPTPPEPGVKKFRIELIANTSDRACHWPGSNEDYFYENEYDEPEETPEYTGELDQSLSLKEINSIVKEEGLDESKVFFTASFSDDYLCIEVVHIREQTESEIQEDYDNQLSDWNESQKKKHEAKLENIKRQMKNLQKQADFLKNKKD